MQGIPEGYKMTAYAVPEHGNTILDRVGAVRTYFAYAEHADNHYIILKETQEVKPKTLVFKEYACRQDDTWMICWFCGPIEDVEPDEEGYEESWDEVVETGETREVNF